MISAALTFVFAGSDAHLPAVPVTAGVLRR